MFFKGIKILIFLIISCLLLIIIFVINSSNKNNKDPDVLYFSSVNNEEEILPFERTLWEKIFDIKHNLKLEKVRKFGRLIDLLWLME